MAKRGRPSHFTPENREKILTAVRLGTADMIMGASAGVDYSTIRGWVAKGEKEGKGEFYEFSLALKAAKGERVNRWLAMIEKAAQIGTWQAAAWKLERLYPEQYGRTVQRVENVGADGKALPAPETHVHVNLDLSRLNDDELELYRRLASRGAVEAAGSPPGGVSGTPPA